MHDTRFNIRSVCFVFLFLSFIFIININSAYAFTEDDIKTLSYNWFVNARHNNTTDAMDYVTNYDYSAIEQYTNNSDYYLIAFCNSDWINSYGDLYIWICKKKSQNPYMYQYQTNYNRVNNVDRYYVIICGNNNNLPYYQTTDYHDINGNFIYLRDNTLKVMYSQVDIYNQQYTNIWWIAGTYTPTWLFDSVNFDSFYFDMRPYSSSASFEIDNITLSNVPVYTYNGMDFYFGELVDQEYLNYINDELVMYYFNGSTWESKRLFFRVFNSDDILTIPNNNMIYNTRLSEHIYNSFYLRQNYCFTNTLYWYSVLNGDGSQADAVFYLGDSSTIISNGSIDTTSLPSNYLEQFANLGLMINDNNNTENIINDINDNNNIDNLLNDNFSGDYTDIADKFGYQPKFNSGDNVISAFINGIAEVLTTDQDVYFDYRIRLDQAPVRIWASDLTTPETPLKSFIRLGLIFGTIYIIYMHIREIIFLINEGQAIKVFHLEDADMYLYKM